MSTLKASIALSTTTLYPTPVNISVVATEQVSGSADFQTIILAPDETQTIYGPSLTSDPSSTVYFYVQADSANTTNVDIYSKINSTVSSSILATLRPNDFMWVPLAAYASGLEIKATNLNGLNSSVLKVFWGERS